MDEHLIEHIDTYDFTPKAVTQSFSWACGFLRKKRGYARSSKPRRYLKKLAHKRVRQYFRTVRAGRRGSFQPVSGWDVI